MNNTDNIPAVHYPLTCPHCQVTGKVSILLAASTFTDDTIELVCYCYNCKKQLIKHYENKWE